LSCKEVFLKILAKSLQKPLTISKGRAIVEVCIFFAPHKEREDKAMNRANIKKGRMNRWLVAFGMCLASALVSAALIAAPTAAALDANAAIDDMIAQLNDSVTTTVAGETTTVVGETTTVAGETTTVVGETTTVVGETTTVTGDTTTVPGETTTSAYPRRTRVSGYSALYTVVDAPGGQSRLEFVVSAPTADNPQRVVRHPVHVRNNNHYIQLMARPQGQAATGTGVYVRIRGGTTADSVDLTTAVWHGPDGVFGNADDVSVQLRGDNMNRWYRATGNGEWTFVANFDLAWFAADVRPPVQGDTSTTTAVTTTGAGTTASFVAPGIMPPQTGVDFNTSALVATFILALGGGYCAWRYFKKDKDEDEVEN